ncbi:Acyl-coenzyme A thioesterase PaaI, contains HGG motif [Frankia sp. AiPs1]|uniref:acyl-CoA thioesterase domain-containing protein n=1 Tax=Frankia sp. AiPa1 TaxID=573492 RepID=UPI00202B2DD6|nr:acyl-CoA thioesterase domain-containing protein [Frankia sp. AiPa1]MCL9758100.1 thioesterase family protein [Frankia sp. AiPa1]
MPAEAPVTAKAAPGTGAADRTGSASATAAEPVRHSFLSDMAFTELLVSDQRCLTIAPLTGAVRSRAGFASAAAIISLFDVSASHPTLIATRPDWTATQDISVLGASRIMDGPIVVDSQLVRVGKKTVIASAEIYDAHGVDDPHELRRRLVDTAPATGTGTTSGSASGPGSGPQQDVAGLTRAGRALVTFARIPRIAAPGMDDYDPGQWIGEIRPPADVVGPPPDHLHDALGLRLLDAATGQLELDRGPSVLNSIGTILGGALAALVEAAAEAMCPDAITIDLQLHYLAQVRSGPARTAGRVVRDTGEHCVVTMTVVDAGAEDRILALATVTLLRATSA